MAGRLGNERFLLLVTLRPEEARDAIETLENLGRSIQLGPLTEAAVQRLAAVMGVPELAEPIYRLTGGDVLFSVEAFRLAADSDRAADALEVARSLREVVVERIRRPATRSRGFLRVAAVAGYTLDIDLVGRVQNIDPARAARLAERGVQAGLLTTKGDSLAFANRVIHEVLYDTTPPAVRASLTAASPSWWRTGPSRWRSTTRPPATGPRLLGVDGGRRRRPAPVRQPRCRTHC